MTTGQPSLYSRLGGAPALQAAVDEFYARMLADERVTRFFDDVDMEQQKGKQRAFLAFVTGGTTKYTGQDMRAGHAHLLERGLDSSHVDVVIQHLGETLAGLGASSEDIAAVAALAESVRDDVLGRCAPPLPRGHGRARRPCPLGASRPPR